MLSNINSPCKGRYPHVDSHAGKGFPAAYAYRDFQLYAMSDLTMHGCVSFILKCSLDDLEELKAEISRQMRKFPKKKREKKKVSPEELFRIECHRHAKEWLSKNGYDDYQWSAAQNKGLNGLLENIRCSLCKNPQKYPVVTPESVTYSFAAFMCSLPPFYANKVDFLTFHHKFNAIVQEIRSIKNGQQHSATTSIANGQFSERFQSVAERIAARHATK